MNILITGGTGLLGGRLVDYFSSLGMFPRLLSRKEDLNAEISRFEWNIRESKIDPSALEGVDVLIHLAGANVGEGRWTANRKKEIIDSRIDSTQLLYEAVAGMQNKPKTLICASATGYYGLQEFDHESQEDENAGGDFLAQVCEKWESEADRFQDLGLRVVKLRTGVVFDESGGALQKMTLPIRWFAGAPLGSGKQIIPWIHWKDWCGAVGHLVNENELSGAYNLVAPEPVTNATLTRLIARVIGRPLFLPNVPAFVLKLMLGEMSSIVLRGHKVSSQKLEASGFKFQYTSAEQALSELLGRD
ncbi:MAG: TIGR01777 family oxidoreductase [Reichenbachiella sp.]|uniref:TIGR01777 family oxidoreductase n=1 Tax=Reichenbachiella sp. TaxID=2184521 RepID=UPI002966D74B|nr:TIGR01777 family oxidoreductase [Reichenbachiella sp.]MDW3208779.1 TIGR01777 family oxidoreductase [Reichenbachiella sp.]